MRSDVTFQGLTFPTHQIKSLQAAQTASLDMRRMEVDTVELTVKTGTEIYGLITSDGYPLFTSDGYRLCASESFALEQWSQANPVKLLRGGSQYALWYPRQLKQLAGDFYAISATSTLGKLTQMEHRGGIYDGVEAGGLIREICGDVDVYVSPVFEHVPLYGFLPYVSPSGLPSAVKGSAKDNLLKVLFALNASLRVDASGTIRIENLNTEVSSVIDSGRVYRENAAVVDDVPVTSVTVLEHQYIEGTENKTLFEGTTTAGQIVIFRDPCSDLVATGFSILSSGANWAELSAGTGTLTGKPYVHITREVTRPVSESDTENAVRIEDATLVGITNSGDVADRMADYYAHRKRITCDATVEFERPGDVVSIWDSVAKVMRQACIEKMSPLNLSGTMKAKLSALVGFTPWQTVPFEDVRVVIPISMTYHFPSFILPGTNVNGYVIGGGDGGENGQAGGNSETSFAYKTFDASETGTVTIQAGAGGVGGVGGNGGTGGKILRFSITVDPEDVFTCTIGQGGSKDNGVGLPTLFGAYTSEDGSAATNGWTDPTSGEVFADAGERGTNGADGGKGGDFGGVGSDGGSVLPYIGGSGGIGYSSVLSNDAVRIGGGGGSGASVEADGENGGNASFRVINYSRGVLESAGSNGKDGGARTGRNTFGGGGYGGHGGSGAGGAGAVQYQKTGTNSGSVGVNLYAYGKVGGAPGISSAGVQGCAALFFRVPQGTKMLRSLTITTPPNKTAYVSGETFDAAGLSAAATYNDGTTTSAVNIIYPTMPLLEGQAFVPVAFVDDGIIAYAKQAITVTNAPGQLYEYLESVGCDGRQWIDTGLDAAQEYTITGGVSFSGSGVFTVVGVLERYFDWISYQNQWRIGGRDYIYYNQTTPTASKYDYVVTLKPENPTLTLNSQAIALSTITLTSPQDPNNETLWLGSRYGSAEYAVNGRIYRTTFSGVADFRPARRLTDGIIGFYETVSGQFYRSIGSADFLE